MMSEARNKNNRRRLFVYAFIIDKVSFSELKNAKSIKNYLIGLLEKRSKLW